MGTDLFTLTPDTVVASALRLATTRHVHHFLVIEDGSLTGIVCDEDLRHARQGTLVGQCMSSPVLCIAPDTTIEDAETIMEQNAVGCLPVVTGSFLVGIVTREKLARLVRVRKSVADTDVTDEFELKIPPSCAACGTEKLVKARPEAGLVTLCDDCSGTNVRSAARGN